jgi:hypothetical protein
MESLWESACGVTGGDRAERWNPYRRVPLGVCFSIFQKNSENFTISLFFTEYSITGRVFIRRLLLLMGKALVNDS